MPETLQKAIARYNIGTIAPQNAALQPANSPLRTWYATSQGLRFIALPDYLTH